MPYLATSRTESKHNGRRGGTQHNKHSERASERDNKGGQGTLGRRTHTRQAGRQAGRPAQAIRHRHDSGDGAGGGAHKNEAQNQHYDARPASACLTSLLQARPRGSHRRAANAQYLEIALAHSIAQATDKQLSATAHDGSDIQAEMRRSRFARALLCK